jgi:hypothetical protein
MPYKINLREVVYSLSTALDYVGVDDIFHGKRASTVELKYTHSYL